LSDQIISSIIQSITQIIASFITVVGAWLILKHRRKVILLTENIEAYYNIEKQLVRSILVERGITNPTDHQINQAKSNLRKEALGLKRTKLLTSKEAKAIKYKYFG